MKAIIFAGGVGTRLWPLSRKKTPKQFEKVVDDKSTLELAVERLIPEFKPEDIFVSTGMDYVARVREILSMLPADNIIGEPVKKDVGPAVALITSYIEARFGDEPMVILWSDHLVKKQEIFKNIVLTAGDLVQREKNKIVFIGQSPRFASENLGWIQTGSEKVTENNVTFREFIDFKYRPDEATAKQYFASDKYCWNLGYFVTTAGFLSKMFEKHAKNIYDVTQKIVGNGGVQNFQEQVMKYYPEMPEINFDKAVLENLDPESSYVVIEDIGWSDIGAWEALKEALSTNESDSIQKGHVELKDCNNSLVYNYQDGKFIVGIGLDDMVVVNTDDVILVGKKSEISKVKQVVESFANTENEKYT